MAASLSRQSSVASGAGEVDERQKIEQIIFHSVSEGDREPLLLLFQDENLQTEALQVLLTKTVPNHEGYFCHDEDVLHDAAELLGPSVTNLNAIHIAALLDEDDIAMDILDFVFSVTEEIGGKKVLNEFIGRQWGDGNTLLHLASFYGMSALVQRLLSLGANPNRKNDRGYRPVDCVDDLETRKHFLAHQQGNAVKVQQPGHDNAVKRPRSASATEAERPTQVIETSKDDLSNYRRVKSSTPDVFNAKTPPMQSALSSPHLLLGMKENGLSLTESVTAKPTKKKGKRVKFDATTMVLDICQFGDPEDTEKLPTLRSLLGISDGNCEKLTLNPNALRTPHQSLSPLHLACTYGHLSIVRFLLSLPPPYTPYINDTDVEGWTPLHCASAEGHFSIIQELGKCRGRLNENGKREWCASGQQVDGTWYFLPDGPLCVEALNDDGERPFEVATEGNEGERIKMVLKELAKLIPTHPSHRQLVERRDDQEEEEDEEEETDATPSNSFDVLAKSPTTKVSAPTATPFVILTSVPGAAATSKPATEQNQRPATPEAKGTSSAPATKASPSNLPQLNLSSSFTKTTAPKFSSQLKSVTIDSGSTESIESVENEDNTPKIKPLPPKTKVSTNINNTPMRFTGKYLVPSSPMASNTSVTGSNSKINDSLGSGSVTTLSASSLFQSNSNGHKTGPPRRRKSSLSPTPNAVSPHTSNSVLNSSKSSENSTPFFTPSGTPAASPDKLSALLSRVNERFMTPPPVSPTKRQTVIDEMPLEQSLTNSTGKSEDVSPTQTIDDAKSVVKTIVKEPEDKKDDAMKEQSGPNVVAKTSDDSKQQTVVTSTTDASNSNTSLSKPNENPQAENQARPGMEWVSSGRRVPLTPTKQAAAPTVVATSSPSKPTVPVKPSSIPVLPVQPKPQVPPPSQLSQSLPRPTSSQSQINPKPMATSIPQSQPLLPQQLLQALQPLEQGQTTAPPLTSQKPIYSLVQRLNASADTPSVPSYNTPMASFPTASVLAQKPLTDESEAWRTGSLKQSTSKVAEMMQQWNSKIQQENPPSQYGTPRSLSLSTDNKSLPS